MSDLTDLEKLARAAKELQAKAYHAATEVEFSELLDAECALLDAIVDDLDGFLKLIERLRRYEGALKKIEDHYGDPNCRCNTRCGCDANYCTELAREALKEDG